MHILENKILKNKNILLVLEENTQESKELQYLIENFCGIVVKNMSEMANIDASKQRLYVCGNIAQLPPNFSHQQVYIIRELSYHYEKHTAQSANVIALGKVPILVCEAGVYFRAFFEDEDYFCKIKEEHEFQHLTESNRPSQALRKGIYLTPITKKKINENKEILHFYLLRCSSNLTGATDNFRTTDHFIIHALNEELPFIFEQKPALNHVLAQIYENSKRAENPNKESKAKIKAHSDKTKDMPKDGLIIFCTFYEKDNFTHLKPSQTDKYDWVHQGVSGLTKLHFKLKNSVQDESLTKEFSVTLYPNSVFMIPLSTNRLYTHEIKPSALHVDKIPTRMGYVVRCSNTEAIYMDEQTYIQENGNFIKLEQMTEDSLTALRNSYLEENKTEKMVEYGKVHFSMNLGDYLKPYY